MLFRSMLTSQRPPGPLRGQHPGGVPAGRGAVRGDRRAVSVNLAPWPLSRRAPRDFSLGRRSVMVGAVREPPFTKLVRTNPGRAAREPLLREPGRLMMIYDPDSHRRRSIRLQAFDYSRDGAYFLTICTEGGNAGSGRSLAAR